MKTVLIIGATSKTGLAIIDHLAKHPSKPSLHVMCCDQSEELPPRSKELCCSIVLGNQRSAHDIEQALAETQPNWIVISIGNDENVARKMNGIRTANAQATVSVLRKSQYLHVRVLVVSRIGAGTSRIVIGLGLGMLLAYHLRHELADYTGQEAAFSTLTNRVSIVRTTALTDNQPTGHLVYFGDKDKCPSNTTDRADLAAWITYEICQSDFRRRMVNVTSASTK